MTDKYTVEQMHTVGLYLRSKGYKQAGEMLRQAAQMMRDRQLSDAMSTDGLAGRSVDRNKREPVKVTDDDVHEAIEAYVTSDKRVACPDFEAMRAAIESFASRISTGEEFPIHQIQKGDGCWEDITPERYAAIHAGDVGRAQDLPCEARVLYAAPEVTK